MIVNNSQVFENTGEEKAYAWTIAQVKCILKDETYIGNSVHGKQTNISYKNKKRAEKVPDCVGRRVRHSVFGEGTVTGVPRDREGYIIQFDTIHTPRTLGLNGKLEFI